MVVQTIPIDQITIPEIRSNAVFTEEQFAQLKASIQADGIHRKIEVRKLWDNKYELIDGLHRLQCWKELGHTDIEADVKELDEVHAIVQHLTANHARGEADPVGLAKMIKKLRDAGRTYEDIGKLIGYTEATVKGYERLALLPDVFQAALTQGNLKKSHIDEAYRLPDDNDVAAALAYSIQLGWSAAVLHHWVNNRLAELQQAQNSTFEPSAPLQPAPAPDPNLVNMRQCLCCGSHGQAQEMSYWTICLGCHDALAYLKSLNKSPWAAIQTIVKEREELIKAIEQKDAQLKELSQKFIDLSLRLMPAMQQATPSSQTPGTGFSVLPRTQ